MKLLLTAFEPFGGETVNSAGEALALLPDRIAGAEIVKRTLPVAFGASAEALREILAQEKPDAVLCLGQAGGRAALTPERVAVNLCDASVPDNAGRQPVDEPVRAGGPAAYFATLPVKAMAEAIRTAGLPAAVSDTAGTYVCNQLMYALLDELARRYPGTRGGFLHLPWLTEQAAARPDAFGLSREELARGVEAAARAVAESGQ